MQQIRGRGRVKLRPRPARASLCVVATAAGTGLVVPPDLLLPLLAREKGERGTLFRPSPRLAVMYRARVFG